MRIAILYICTGKYSQFFNGFYSSCEEFFLKNKAEKDYFVFTDKLDLSEASNVHLYEKENEGFPLDSLLRFEQFLRVKEQVKTFDYAFFFNANALFVRPVDDELMPKNGTQLVAGVWRRHLTAPMFLPYERNKKSLAYIAPYDGPYTYYGGFYNGGTADAFIEMAEVLANNTRIDYNNGIIAKVHDESHLNYYLHNHPCTGLPIDYIIPEERLQENDKPFLILRDKLRLDFYFNKGRKDGLGTTFKKGMCYVWNAIKWYF